MRADSMHGSAKPPIFEKKDEKSGLNDKLTRENEIRSEFVLINVFSFFYGKGIGTLMISMASIPEPSLPVVGTSMAIK